MGVRRQHIAFWLLAASRCIAAVVDYPLDPFTATDPYAAAQELIDMCYRRSVAINVATSSPAALIAYRVRDTSGSYTTAVQAVVSGITTSYYTNVYYTLSTNWTGFTNIVLPIAQAANTSRFVWIAGGPDDSVFVAAVRAVDRFVINSLGYRVVPSSAYDTGIRSNWWTDPRFASNEYAAAVFASAYRTNYAFGTSWTTDSVVYISRPIRLLAETRQWVDPRLDDDNIYGINERNLADECTNYWRALSFTTSVSVVTGIAGWIVGNYTTQTVEDAVMTQGLVVTRAYPLAISTNRQYLGTNVNNITLGYFTATLWPGSNTAAGLYPKTMYVKKDTSTNKFEFTGYKTEIFDFRLFAPEWWFKKVLPEYKSAGAGYDLYLAGGFPFYDINSLVWSSAPATTSDLYVSISPADTNWISEVSWLFTPASDLALPVAVPHSTSTTQEMPLIFVSPLDLGVVTATRHVGNTNRTTTPQLSCYVGTNRYFAGWTMGDIGSSPNSEPFVIRRIDDWNLIIASGLNGTSVQLSNDLAGLVFNDTIGQTVEPSPLYPNLGVVYASAGLIGVYTGKNPDAVGDVITLTHEPKDKLANIYSASWPLSEEDVFSEALNARWEALSAMRVYGGDATTTIVYHALATQTVADICLDPVATSYDIDDLFENQIAPDDWVLGENTNDVAFSTYGANWGYNHQLEVYIEADEDAYYNLSPLESVHFASGFESRNLYGYHYKTKYLPLWSYNYSQETGVVSSASGHVFALYYTDLPEATNCFAFNYPTSAWYVATALELGLVTTQGVVSSDFDTALDLDFEVDADDVECWIQSNKFTADVLASRAFTGPGTWTGYCGSYSIPSNRVVERGIGKFKKAAPKAKPRYVGVMSFFYTEEE